MYETKVNRLGDEKRVKEICNYLDKITLNIINIEPNFKYYGSKEKGYFNIYNDNKYNKYNEELSMNLDLRLYYPNRDSYFFDENAKNLDDEELDKYIEYKYNESKLFYAQINWFSVNPRRHGYGTKIISELINILKIIDSIEMILLHPTDNDSKLFWLSNNFDNNKIYDNRIKLLTCKDMIYKYY